MKELKPYVSIDIETTGIELECEILQVAAVFDDGRSAIGDLQRLNMKIRYESFIAEPMAMHINRKLIEDMADRNKKGEFFSPGFVAKTLGKFLYDVRVATGERIVMAGKNPGSFDLPRVLRFLERFGVPDFDKIFRHRCIDVGSLWLPVFGENVPLSKINERLNRKPVTHDALEDAFDVVHAIREFHSYFNMLEESYEERQRI